MNYSVLLPVCSSDKVSYFKLSLESMLNQTVRSDDIVVVRDGPVSSEMQQMIDDYASKYEEIHPLLLDTNVGLGRALNEGLKVCRNEIVARMDADDISIPSRCEIQLAMFENNPSLDVVGSMIQEFADTPENIVGQRFVPVEHKDIVKYSRMRDPFNHPTVMYRKSKVLKYGPYGDYRRNQDTDLWIKLLSNGCISANSTEYLLLFRFDRETYRKRKSWINTKTLISIRRNAWKIGYCSFADYLCVAFLQLCIYVLPVTFQRFIYTKILRRSR